MPSVQHYSSQQDSSVSDSFRSNPNEEEGTGVTGSIHSTETDLPKKEHRKATKKVSTWRRNVIIFLTLSCVLLVLVGIIGGVVFAVTSKGSDDESESISPRRRNIEEFLYSNQITTLSWLRETDSPANLAAAFISDEDEMQMQLTEESAKRFVERYVLAFLYFHFEGPQWTRSLNFLSGGNHCDWNEEFESATGEMVRRGVVCNPQGYVSELNLAWNNLHASQIPEQIKFLKELLELHMYYNEIGGYFPDAFREMKNLKSIGLMKMGLIGTLPQWMGEMTSLTSLGLGENYLQGPIPSSVGDLKGLTLLGLNSNDGISGNIAPLKQLSNLEALYLYDNYLSGDLLNANWPKLRELDISGNYITGGLPADILGHPSLQVLDVNNNQISGEFPDVVAFNENLEYLAIHENEVIGSLPSQLGFLIKLKHMDVSMNSLSGALPTSLAQLTELHYLASTGNNFTPQEILDLRGLTKLEDLSMKGNNLNGTIPTWFPELTSLKLLDLDANGLTGSIPAEIGQLVGLNYLFLNRNNLTGILPDLTGLTEMKILLLDGNALTGTADSICNRNFIQMTDFVADCYPRVDGAPVEFECTCCTQCCRPGDAVFFCNDQAWTANVDIAWEVGYQRQEYDFDLVNAPPEYSKASPP